MIKITVRSLITKYTPCKLTFLPNVRIICGRFALVNICMKLGTLSVLPACSTDARRHSRGVDSLCILKTDPGGRGGGFIRNNVTFCTSSHTLVSRYHDPWISSVSPVWHSSMDVCLLCMKFVIRKCCECGHEDRVFFIRYLFSDVFIFISMNSNVVFSLCAPSRRVGNGDRSPLILSFVLVVVSHSSKIQMYCWTFNPTYHTVYWVTSNLPCAPPYTDHTAKVRTKVLE